MIGLAAAWAGSGCGKRAEEKKALDAAKEFQKIVEEMPKDGKSAEKRVQEFSKAAEAMQKAITGDQKEVQLADFRELKQLLPPAVDKLKRTDATGEKTSAMGISVSKAEGRYEGNDDQSLTIEITDLGGMRGVAAFAQFGWAVAEIDRETDTGYEKTVKIGGHTGQEEYDWENKSGSVKIMVAGRFMVDVQGHGIEMARIKGAVELIPLDKLAALAK